MPAERRLAAHSRAAPRCPLRDRGYSSACLCCPTLPRQFERNQPRSGGRMGICAKPAAEQQRNGHWRKTSRGAAEDSSRGRQPPERPAVPISPGGATEILARTADIQSERPRSALCHRYTPRAVTPGSRMADLLGPITIRAAAYFAFFRYGTPLVIHSGAGLPFR
jgi:hypothetical protein